MLRAYGGSELTPAPDPPENLPGRPPPGLDGRLAPRQRRRRVHGPGERFIEKSKTVHDILGEHQDAVVLEGYRHKIIDSREAMPALEEEFLDRQCERRRAPRTAFLEEWSKLERRGRKVWSAASMA